MRTLYPPVEPYSSEILNTGDEHKIYVERCGNQNGIPILFLHGGPGGGCKPDHRQFFDASKYNIILFDQRGAGRSTPYGEIRHNDTQRLIFDIEIIRKRYEIDQWCLFGGSWGATLALKYALEHRKRVDALILRGTFLARKSDFDWFLGSTGAARILPQEWQEFLTSIGLTSSEDILPYLYEQITSHKYEVQKKTALAWDKWSGAVVGYSFNKPLETMVSDENMAISRAKIELHYASNNYFLEENEILDNVNIIQQIKTIIVHGGRDITCLPESSWSLQNKLSNSRLQILRTAGHLSSDADTVDALVAATEEISNLPIYS